MWRCRNQRGLEMEEEGERRINRGKWRREKCGEREKKGRKGTNEREWKKGNRKRGRVENRKGKTGERERGAGGNVKKLKESGKGETDKKGKLMKRGRRRGETRNWK